ncbi:hypothetical protein KUTeg_000786 [Tegillarca granosa]|uniref:Transmembrane and coiled-coil domains protein 1 n=1 Tax=Tegillarca granosa TaxID=220873 RepID=A0ABQ9G1D3_TEGGR|nr:hypothetical protein KUTeg_000786 [Tegillarca granosa]
MTFLVDNFTMVGSFMDIRGKKSEASKIPGLKNLKKAVAKSPSLPKKQSSPDNVGGNNKPKAVSSLSVPASDTVVSSSNLGAKPKTGSNLQLPCDESMVHSTEDLESLEVSSRENGSSGEGGLDDPDGPTPTDGNVDPSRTKAALEHTQSKIQNVNEYLRLAASADKQQLQRIKTVFEKKNQKSTQIISQLQKKLENYHKRLQDIEMYGVSGHKQAKEVLRDMGHGLNSIVSKPKEFAHLIKNKFGKTSMDDSTAGETDKVVSTLPASFKYGSDDDNSSITSGSGLGAHSSPQSASHNTSQQIPVITQISLDPILHELMESKEQQIKLHNSLSVLTEEFQSYKSTVQQEISLLKHLLEIESVRSERLEEQINDMTELHQNEDISSMEEKIEYRLDERTSDIHDLLENCQTRGPNLKHISVNI